MAPRSSEQPPYWDALAVAIAPDRMLLGPEAALMLARALERVHRADGVPLSSAAEHVRQVALAVSRGARGGHEDVPNSRDTAESQAWISTTEAALRLGCTPRHARRLAAQGDLGSVRRQGNRLRVLDAEVAVRLASPTA